MSQDSSNLTMSSVLLLSSRYPATSEYTGCISAQL
jgi:hypothetical protein